MTVTYIEIDSDQRDTTLYTNPYTFDISTNTSSSTTETGQLIGGTPTTRINARQYEVQLQELTIPLSNLSFLNQPYLYVKFENSRSVDNSHFYSNNKSSAGKYFRVPLDNKLLQTNSVYATFKSNMTQIMNLSFQENLTFDIRLPNNTQVTKIDPNTTAYFTDTALVNATSIVTSTAADASNFSIGSTLQFSATVTITIANPAVVTWHSNGLANGDTVVFSTTGTLPAAIVAGQTYFVINSATNTFRISTSSGGGAVSTTGNSQTGQQSVTTAKTIPTGSYTVTSMNLGTGTLGIYPKLQADITIGNATTGIAITNTSDTIDRVTALFELKQIVKY